METKTALQLVNEARAYYDLPPITDPAHVQPIAFHGKPAVAYRPEPNTDATYEVYVPRA